MSSMECQMLLLSLTLLTLLLSTSAARNRDPYEGGISIQMINHCYSTIYPAVFTEKGQKVTPTGFKLDHLNVYDLKVPDYWSGTIWARTACSDANNTFHCAVGDCGSNHIECHDDKIKAPVNFPVTLLKFNIAPKGGISSYKIDLRYGFNVPATITPLGGHCKYITCFRDLRSRCPDLLALYDQEGGKLACKSACYVTNEPKFCCKGAYASEEKCGVNEYTKLIQGECPDAVYNDFNQTIIACSGGLSYWVTFCP